MTNRLLEVLEHRAKMVHEKFYVSFDDDGRIIGVFAASNPTQSNVIEISKELAEEFLNGSILKSGYHVARLGESFVLEKQTLSSSVKSSSTFYKAPEHKADITLFINKQDNTVRVDTTLDGSAVFYVCAKNCFHKLYKSIVIDPNINVYSLGTTNDVDVFVPAHIKNVGIQYE